MLSYGSLPKPMLRGCFLSFLPFFDGFLDPILFEPISSHSSIYGIYPQRFVKILGYHDEFVEFSSYENRGGDLRFIKWRTYV